MQQQRLYPTCCFGKKKGLYCPLVARHVRFYRQSGSQLQKTKMIGSHLRAPSKNAGDGRQLKPTSHSAAAPELSWPSDRAGPAGGGIDICVLPGSPAQSATCTVLPRSQTGVVDGGCSADSAPRDAGMRVADGAVAPGDGGGGGRRRRARRRLGGAPGRLPRRVPAAQGPSRAPRPAPPAPRHHHLQVLHSCFLCSLIP